MEKRYIKALKRICTCYKEKARNYETKAKELVDLAWLLLDWKDNEITLTKNQLIEMKKILKPIV